MAVRIIEMVFDVLRSVAGGVSLPGRRWARLCVAAVCAVALLCAGVSDSYSLDYGRLPLAYEIKGYPATGDFQNVYSFSINWKDDTVTVLAGQPVSMSVFRLGNGGPLKQFVLEERLKEPVTMWACDGRVVIRSGGDYFAYGADGKRERGYEPPVEMKDAGLARAVCAPQGGLLVLDYSANLVSLAGKNGSVQYPAACGENEKSCRNSRVDARIGRLIDAAMEPLGGLFVIDAKGGAIKLYDYKGGFRKSVLGTQSFDDERMRLSMPSAIAVGARGDIYILDRGDHTLKVFDDFGYPKYIFRDSGAAGFLFQDPFQMQSDRMNHLLILDRGTHSLKVFDISNLN